jgi:hypothetical protein
MPGVHQYRSPFGAPASISPAVGGSNRCLDGKFSVTPHADVPMPAKPIRNEMQPSGGNRSFWTAPHASDLPDVFFINPEPDMARALIDTYPHRDCKPGTRV